MHELASAPLDYLKVHLGLEVLDVQPIPSWQQQVNTFVVTTSEDSYALKVFPGRQGGIGELSSRLFGGIAFSNQLKVLTAVADSHLNHFRVPELVATDGRSFLLTRYVPQLQVVSYSLGQKRRLAAALFEWHELDIRFEYSLRERIVRSARRQLAMRVALRTIPRLTRAHGMVTAIRSLAATFACSRRSQRDARGWLEHGDFVQSNEFVEMDGDVYFVDFASTSVKRSGRFTDIVMHAVNYDENGGIDIDWELIGCYIDALGESPVKRELYQDDEKRLTNDLRLALLLRVMHYIAKYDAAVRQSAQWGADRAVLRDLLDGRRFQETAAANDYWACRDPMDGKGPSPDGVGRA